MNDTLILDEIVKVLAKYAGVNRGLSAEHVEKMRGAIVGLRVCEDRLQDFISDVNDLEHR